jgi:hypothetical protein
VAVVTAEAEEVVVAAEAVVIIKTVIASHAIKL